MKKEYRELLIVIVCGSIGFLLARLATGAA